MNAQALEFPFERNPYESIVVDITSRCNMRCNFCYNPDYDTPDMTLEYFRDFCARLPRPVALKLLGGEPTLHPQLIEFMRVAHQHGHTVYIGSNGARYADAEFMGSLAALKKRSGVTFSLGLSMDGGCSNRYAYEAITGVDCLQQKVAAFESLVRFGLGRICLTAMVVRGLNESVIPELLKLGENKNVRYVHFRNAAHVGRSAQTEPYSIGELKKLVGGYFTPRQFAPHCVRELHCPPQSGRTCCYRFRPDDHLQVSLIEFASEQSSGCVRRGRLLNGARTIRPFFESMKA